MDSRNTLQSSPNERALHIPQRRFVSENSGKGGVQHGHADEASAPVQHVVRQQIDRIYQQNPPNQPATHKTGSAQNPYQRTHQPQFDWQKYHTAWQQYYQQYYQRYYWQQLHTERQKLAAAAADKAAAEATGLAQPPKSNSTGEAVAPQSAKLPATPLHRLKTDIVQKVQERAKKVRRSHHFVPILSALGVGMAFIFLQFNSVLFAQIESYISPGAISDSAISINPAAAVNVGPDPRLIIPKIHVDIPVDYNVTTLNEATIQNSLRDGTTHYKLPGANAMPGQNGNTVILGHSSNDIFNQGAYKFAFVLLDRLQPGDVFYLHYEGTRYIYRVTESKIIDPTDLNALRIGNEKPMATLITCTPPGTALQRLIVFGEQISPDPSAATTPAAQPASQPQDNILPGNEPTLLDNIWSFFF